MITWPVPHPVLPEAVQPVLAEAARAATAVSLLRPQHADTAAWWRIAERAERVRILSSSCLEAALVAEGSTDAFADVGGDRHRLVDLAPAMVLLPAAGGSVIDAFGRPIEVADDLSRRWSGVVAASATLAEELAAVISGSQLEQWRTHDAH
jgi:myo-inositol-1(or 4)-monophosphatase